MRILAALALVVVFLSACTDGAAPPGQTNIDVDTPKLREMKTEAGIETCAIGPGGGALPDLTLPCLGGGPDVNLSDLRGPVLINLWYSACGPCREEMPALQTFYERHGTEVGVLGLDVENYPEAAISFAGMVGATYPQLADPGEEIFDQAGLRLAQAFPQTILLDAEGQIAFQTAESFDSVSAIEDLVTDHLDVTLAPR